MTKEELRQDMAIYLRLHPDDKSSFLELYDLSKKLPNILYRSFKERYFEVLMELICQK